MKFKGTLVLLAIFLAVGAIAYYYEYKGGPQRESKEKSAKKLLALEKAKVKEIHLHYPDKEIVALREGDSTWKITAPIATTGDGAEWNKLATSLADLEKEKVLEENPGDLKPFGLDPPVLKVSATADDGKASQVLFGFPNPTGSSVYAKVPDKKEVVLVPNLTYQAIKKELADLRERRLLRFNEFEAGQLQLKSPQSTVGLARTEAEKVWEIKEPVATRADASNVSALLNTLGMTKVNEFVDYNVPTDAEMGFDKPTLTIMVVEGKGGEGADPEKGGGKAGASSQLVIGAVKKVNEADFYYAKDTSRKDVMLVERSVFDRLHRSLNDLRAKDIVTYHRFEVDGLDIISGKGSFVLRKDKNQWYLGPAPAAKDASADGSEAAKDPRPKVKSDKVLAMFNALESYKVTEFVDHPAALSSYGLEKPRLEVVLWKGEDRLVHLFLGNDARAAGKSSGDQRLCYAKVKTEPYIKIIARDVLDKFTFPKADLLESEPKP